LLNLSDWPADRIAGFKMLLRGGTVIPQDHQAITITRSLPHGHVAAALGSARKIDLDRLLGSVPGTEHVDGMARSSISSNEQSALGMVLSISLSGKAGPA
jgi:hypothetical protein